MRKDLHPCNTDCSTDFRTDVPLIVAPIVPPMISPMQAMFNLEKPLDLKRLQIATFGRGHFCRLIKTVRNLVAKFNAKMQVTAKGETVFAFSGKF